MDHVDKILKKLAQRNEDYGARVEKFRLAIADNGFDAVDSREILKVLFGVTLNRAAYRSVRVYDYIFSPIYRIIKNG